MKSVLSRVLIHVALTHGEQGRLYKCRTDLQFGTEKLNKIVLCLGAWCFGLYRSVLLIVHGSSVSWFPPLERRAKGMDTKLLVAERRVVSLDSRMLRLLVALAMVRKVFPRVIEFSF